MDAVSLSRSGWVRRGRAFRTPPGLRRSNGKKIPLGAAVNLPGALFLIKVELDRMETPPICNYEGSDYQDEFWEQGGRAYEDAVEAVALRRLLPVNGRLLLELGAGAGRNTPRYEGYERIVVLDYSHSQLERARNALGTGPRYIYVAADIYRLPFVDGLFDGATMIRTLHHMAEASQALAQVRRVLLKEACFILEFANKQNIKAILRWMLHRQYWNPFSPEPVEFVALNYDFLPATVRAWLKQTDFIIERQLTVSHYRIGFFKKYFPVKLLVWMDSMAQLTGDLWQLSPSVFVRARAAGDAVQPAATGTFFRCPACGAALEDTPPQILCPQCSRVYPVDGGIYDFRLPLSD
jgi:ubiquinone/menaquinone biosynthesis C-methylase UbiE